jgi:hypothetical protein
MLITGSTEMALGLWKLSYDMVGRLLSFMLMFSRLRLFMFEGKKNQLQKE